MALNLRIDEELLFNHIKGENQEEVLKTIAKKLHQTGYVKEEFIEAIMTREHEYPTGLPSSAPAVAIPHTNYDLVNRTTIAVATLEQPIVFYNMEAVNEKIDVQIIIMLAIAEPKGQIEMLQKIIEFIQSDQLRNELLFAQSKEEMLTITKKIIDKGE